MFCHIYYNINVKIVDRGNNDKKEFSLFIDDNNWKKYKH